MTKTRDYRSYFRLRLSTCLTVLLISGGLLGISFWKKTERGWFGKAALVGMHIDEIYEGPVTKEYIGWPFAHTEKNIYVNQTNPKFKSEEWFSPWRLAGNVAISLFAAGICGVGLEWWYRRGAQQEPGSPAPNKPVKPTFSAAARTWKRLGFR